MRPTLSANEWRGFGKAGIQVPENDHFSEEWGGDGLTAGVVVGEIRGLSTGAKVWMLRSILDFNTILFYIKNKMIRNV